MKEPRDLIQESAEDKVTKGKKALAAIMSRDWPYKEPFNIDKDLDWYVQELHKSYCKEHRISIPTHYYDKQADLIIPIIPSIYSQTTTQELINIHKKSCPNFDYESHSNQYTRDRILSELGLEKVTSLEILDYKYKGKYKNTPADIIEKGGKTYVIDSHNWDGENIRNCFEINEKGEKTGDYITISPIIEHTCEEGTPYISAYYIY